MPLSKKVSGIACAAFLAVSSSLPAAHAQSPTLAESGGAAVLLGLGVLLMSPGQHTGAERSREDIEKARHRISEEGVRGLLGQYLSEKQLRDLDNMEKPSLER